MVLIIDGHGSALSPSISIIDSPFGVPFTVIVNTILPCQRSHPFKFDIKIFIDKNYRNISVGVQSVFPARESLLNKLFYCINISWLSIMRGATTFRFQRPVSQFIHKTTEHIFMC